MKDPKEIIQRLKVKENLKYELKWNEWNEYRNWGEGDDDGYDLAYLHGKALYPKKKPLVN
jgi:hypothetical protein